MDQRQELLEELDPQSAREVRELVKRELEVLG